jgi:Fe-Mn family superoxide dismutase
MKKILILICALIFTFPTVTKAEQSNNIAQNNIMKIRAKDYSYVFDKVDGLSKKQLQQHYVLYTRYVNKINEINKNLDSINKDTVNAAHSEYRSLKIDRAFSNNGVILHELYFENLCSKKINSSDCFIKKIEKDFGSFENYLADLTASMKSVRNGWVITAYNPLKDKIKNETIEFHDLYLPINIKPLVVADVWEHSYMIDYGIEKDNYIKVFLNNINWQVVSKRYKQTCLLD